MMRRCRLLILAASAACCGISATVFAADTVKPTGTARPTIPSLSEHVTGEVRRQLDYATSLAERGATLSAREECTAALKLIARALDSGNADGSRSRILERSLRDLFEESAAGNSAEQSQLRQQRYQSAAQHLAKAFAGQPLASQSLYTLGRFQLIAGPAAGVETTFSKARAMSLFLAAIGSDRGNSAAAHELGTMFAALSQLEQAAYWLELSSQNASHPETWENLAAVYDRLQRPEKAAAARQEAERLSSDSRATSTSGVTWVDQAVFARMGGTDLTSVPTSIERASGEFRSIETRPSSTGDAVEKKPAAGWKWPSFSGRGKR
jgi:tetratricopeptide (TPR) repeat protein